MALELKTEFHGIEVPKAYCTVGNLHFPSDSKTAMGFFLSFRASSGTPECFRQEHFAAPYDITGADPYKQAYTYLKSLPEFENSVDC